MCDESKMLVPISMEDNELFPKDDRLQLPQGNANIICPALSPDHYAMMHSGLSRLWWSRLVISVRGYLANYVHSDDERLFLCDDAFIEIHQHLVESSSDVMIQFLADLAVIVNYPNVVAVIKNLNNGATSPNPFIEPNSKSSFVKIFGKGTPSVYRVANSQIIAHVIFMHVFSILQQRWLSSAKKTKGIRFKEDPEWQPDNRVVLFQLFFRGNRTWVLTDFDRHILKVWRPHGSSVIFGDRFIADMRRLGHSLCAYCGMLEQHIGQFGENSDAPDDQRLRFCSSKCAQASKNS